MERLGAELAEAAKLIKFLTEEAEASEEEAASLMAKVVKAETACMAAEQEAAWLSVQVDASHCAPPEDTHLEPPVCTDGPITPVFGTDVDSNRRVLNPIVGGLNLLDDSYLSSEGLWRRSVHTLSRWHVILM